MSQSMEDKKGFRFYRLMLDTALELDDDKMRADYFIALAKYGLDGEIPANPVMRALLKGAMYSIDKNTDKNQKISSSMEGNSNAIKNWENIQKQLITVEDSGTQFLSGSIEDNKKKKIKKEKKENRLVPVDELVEAYNKDTQLVEQINDEGVVRRRAEYKQSTKGGYKTTSGFIRELRAIVRRVLFGMPFRGDIAKRISYGMDKAINRTKPRESIYWNEQLEQDYQNDKRYLTPNQNNDERIP